MENHFKKLGNIELFRCFLAMHYRQFNFFEGEFKEDPRSLEYLELSKKIINKFNEVSIFDIYLDLYQEAKNRGLELGFVISPDIIYSDEFTRWKEQMKSNPTYIREIEATNFIGGYDISFADDPIMGFDYPVREACKILNRKGYVTYWSSANREDYLSRIGQVVKDKSVAYILIDSLSLTDELKKQLLLDGRCDFWGIAQKHIDEGRYYGIWEEIISKDMLCSDVSNGLSTKALELPLIEKTKEPENNTER